MNLLAARNSRRFRFFVPVDFAKKIFPVRDPHLRPDSGWQIEAILLYGFVAYAVSSIQDNPVVKTAQTSIGRKTAF
jgi:hypothetical protein